MYFYKHPGVPPNILLPVKKATLELLRLVPVIQRPGHNLYFWEANHLAEIIAHSEGLAGHANAAAIRDELSSVE